jgi:hypothetical protein
MQNLDFEEKVENWNVYECEDGTIIKIKLVLTGVLRDEKKNDFGENLVHTTWTVAAKVIPPKPRELLS